MTDTAETHVPQEHSNVVGGSTAARRIGCPASYTLEKMVPKSAGSAYAREGTALHEMIAKVLDDDTLPAELLPFTHNQPEKQGEPAWTLTIGDDLWDELGQVALDAFDDFVDEIEHETGAVFKFMIEKRCAFPGIIDAFGVSDVIWRCGNLAGIVDWKFGRGFVPSTTPQLRFYMKAALSDFPGFFDGVDEFRLGICQPRVKEAVVTSSYTHDDLEDFAIELRASIAEAVEKGAAATLEKGSWCTFADCRAVCPLHLGSVSALGKLLAEKEAHDKAVGATPAGETPPSFDVADFLAKAMELAPDVEAWAKKIAAMTQEHIDNGHTVPGWKTIKKKSSGRIWAIDDEKVANCLRYRGLKIDEYAPRKLITAPAAEKMLKKIGKDLPETSYEMKESSGTTLVPSDDPRPAAKRPSDVVAGLAQALADNVNNANK